MVGNARLAIHFLLTSTTEKGRATRSYESQLNCCRLTRADVRNWYFAVSFVVSRPIYFRNFVRHLSLKKELFCHPGSLRFSSWRNFKVPGKETCLVNFLVTGSPLEYKRRRSMMMTTITITTRERQTQTQTHSRKNYLEKWTKVDIRQILVFIIYRRMRKL